MSKSVWSTTIILEAHNWQIFALTSLVDVRQ